MELFREARGEVCLRVSAILALVLTACLVGFDSQTKTVFYIEKKATYKDLEALRVLVYTTSAAAGYNLLQICKHFVSALPGGKSRGYFLYIAWVCFLLDQMAVYMTFGANTAALEASMIAVTGVEALQWIKACDKFTRFCIQMGGAFLCGYLASILMALISSVSAFKLFNFYSPKWFLHLKASSY